ncbi:MAG TPA: transcription antitermination factor NusB [Hyphomicrobiales bacterium]|nr:transcription antitermination factor NusB [Hyphomicrobiales bacterium]
MPHQRTGTVTPAPGAPGLAPRRAATRLVDDVLRRRRPLEEGLEAADGPLAGLDQRGRALARAIAGATLRRLGTLRAALAPHLRKSLPDRAGHLDAILLTGAAQLLLLGVPDHAAVALAVAQARASKPTAPFAALVNAVLRNLARDRDGGRLPPDDPLADQPDWLRERRIAAYGAAAAAAMAAAERHEPALDLTVKSAPELWATRLDGVVLPAGTVRAVAHGPVPGLPGFAEGAWWVQDAAAALPARLLGEVAGTRVADLCAAPGGKTAQLAAAGAAVVAVDRSAARLARLDENLARLHLSAETVVADAAEWRGGPFDAVLLDAPCSATGTIRRHPDVAWLKRPEDVAALAAVQARLLDAAVSLLKPGGTLVYATCSLEPEEGEAQVAALLSRMPGLARRSIVPGEAGIPAGWINHAGELRTLPHHLPAGDPRMAGLDGFFAARLVKD